MPKIDLFSRKSPQKIEKPGDFEIHEISHYRERHLISTLEEVDPTTKMVATVPYL
jgi:hypothetical protein